MLYESCYAESCYAESCYTESCHAESCVMSQPLTVAHRSGQLAYPTWAAHTTNCLDLLVDGARRCEGSGQANQALGGVMLYVPHVRIRYPVAHSLDEERIHPQAKRERGPPRRTLCPEYLEWSIPISYKHLRSVSTNRECVRGVP
jgi:hypothetical protein